ncbi:hypothetical protein DICPUDRAFT_30387, partial [Dictyostelium purpureum]
SQDGIKKLLEAERTAQKIVNDARQDRVQKLKKAVEEAEKEIKEFREKKDKEYKEYESKYFGASTETATQLLQSANEEIETIRTETAANKEKVVDLLIKYACEVNNKNIKV